MKNTDVFVASLKTIIQVAGYKGSGNYTDGKLLDIKQYGYVAYHISAEHLIA